MTTTARVRLYLWIWGALFALTLAEIAVAYMGISKAALVTWLVLLATVKAGLVGLFYMHLRWEHILLGLLATLPFLMTAGFAAVLIMENSR